MSSVTLYAWLTGAGCWQRGLEPSLHDLVEWDWVQIFLQNKYGGECRLGRAMSFWSVLGFPASKHQERVSMNFFNGPFGHQEAWCEQFIGDFIYRDLEFSLTVESLRKRTCCCCSQPVSRILATVLEWLTGFLTGAIMESRKAARSKAVASPSPPLRHVVDNRYTA